MKLEKERIIETQTDPVETLATAHSRCHSVAESIKRYIIVNQLSAGDPLPTESKMKEVLGVSRSSIREAMSKLEALDVVNSRRGSGSVVGEMSLQPLVETLLLRSVAGKTRLDSLRQVVQLRCFLDQGLAQAVTSAFHGKSHPKLREVVEKMKIRALSGKRFPDEDIEFHTILVETINNDVLSQMVAALWNVHTAAFSVLDSQVEPGRLESALAHEKILDAAESGDADKYRKAIEEHYKPLIQFIEENADKF